MSTQHEPDDGDINEVPSPSRPASRIKIFSLDQVLDRPRGEWAVRKLIRRRELVGIYAKPGVGKTLAAIELMVCTASGKPWLGNPVHAGPVLYLAGEGTVGMGNRLTAAFLGVDGGRAALKHELNFMLSSLEFLSPEQFDELFEAIKSIQPAPVLIFVDPLARFMGAGDENLARDMGLFVSRCEQLRDLCDATVVILHHTGKDGVHERGSMAWRAGLDVVLKITEVSDGLIEIKGDKAKDAKEMPSTHAKLEIEWLGHDEFGDRVSSVRLIKVDMLESGRFDGMEDSPKPSKAESIRKALAFFGEPTAAEPIYKTAGVSSTHFYRLIQVEEEEGRVHQTKRGVTRLYELSEKALEYASRTVRPASHPADSRGTNNGTDPQSDRSSHSPPIRPPKGAVEWNGREGSQHEDSTPQQQKKKKKKAKRARAKRESSASPYAVREPVESACSIHPFRPDQVGAPS